VRFVLSERRGRPGPTSPAGGRVGSETMIGIGEGKAGFTLSSHDFRPHPGPMFGAMDFLA
jgi:hypothetical protein